MSTVITAVGLAERIRTGDPHAETELAQRFCGRVLALALVRTRDREVARDLAQEIMLAVIGGLREGRLRDQDSLTGYIYAIAKNQVNSFLRTRRIERDTAPSCAPALDRFDPETTLQDAERLRSALRAIDQLDAADRQILRLTLLEGLQPRAIAVRLGLKPEVVRKRKSRAMRRAREMMRGDRVTKPAADRLIVEETQ